MKKEYKSPQIKKVHIEMQRICAGSNQMGVSNDPASHKHDILGKEDMDVDEWGW